MTSLSFPDINVWLALVASEHVHHASANRWWEQDTGRIGFSRFTQLGFLRLMTTAAAMDGKPLTMAEAWRVHDRLFSDDRVALVPEPAGIEKRFRECASGRTASLKLLADAWLEAFADSAGGVMVTFDRALAARARNAVLLR
jgi:toxin-antitoxin system PIN domain toxin